MPEQSIVRVLMSKKGFCGNFLKEIVNIYQFEAWELGFKKMHVTIFSRKRLLWKQSCLNCFFVAFSVQFLLLYNDNDNDIIYWLVKTTQ